jgi:hypothetical protein
LLRRDQDLSPLPAIRGRAVFACNGWPEHLRLLARRENFSREITRGLHDQDAIETDKPPTRMERAVGRRSASLGFGVGGR